MEKTPKNLEGENPSLQSSPKSKSSGSTSSSDHTESPPTPRTISICDTKGSSTTFIQADTNSFKQVVQMLTGGSPEATKQASRLGGGPVKTGPKKPGFKLQERRKGLKNLKIVPGLAVSSALSPSQVRMLSPSVLDLHRLVLSPVTLLNSESFDRSSPSGNSSSLEEDKVIAEKGFYLYASPVTTPRGSEPQLLPLFPFTN